MGDLDQRLAKEPLGARSITALGLGLVGMGLLFFGDDRAMSGDPLEPMVVLAAMSWGLGTAAMKYFRFSLSVTVLTGGSKYSGCLLPQSRLSGTTKTCPKASASFRRSASFTI